MKNAGFTLPEMLIALAISSVILIGAARMLPLLQTHNLRILTLFQLREELQQIMNTLEKAIRRAGYCHGTCSGEAVKVETAQGTCLLVRWDENSNGIWEAPERQESDFYGYRLRASNVEAQRGVAHCDSGGWEKLNDPSVIAISEFHIVRQAALFQLRLSGFIKAFPQNVVTVERWITAVNL